MALTYSKVICLESRVTTDMWDTTVTPAIHYPVFGAIPTQVYEMDDRVAQAYIAEGWCMAYDSTMFTNPKLPSIIRTNVIHVGA